VFGWLKRSSRPFWEERLPLSDTESGALLAERHPVGSKDRAPGGGPGAKPPEAKHYLASERGLLYLKWTELELHSKTIVKMI